MPINKLPTIILAACLLCANLGNAVPAGHLILGEEGSNDAPLILMPRQVEEGPDGNLYILDTGDGTIKVYSPAGEFLRSLGGEGEGPGEFQRRDGATFGFTPEGLLFFTEYFGGHRWLTFLHLDGSLERTLPPQLETFYGIEKVHPLTGGKFLVQMATDAKVQPVGDVYHYTSPQVLTIMDTDGLLRPEIVRTEIVDNISTSPNGGTSTLPFTPTFTWVLNDSGNIVWSDGLSPQFRILDLKGQELSLLSTPLPQPVKVSAAELSQWKKDRKEMMLERYPTWWDRFGRAIESYNKPLTPKPILKRLTLTPEGYILVEGLSAPGETEVPYWLLDKQGKLISSVTVPAFKLHLSANYLLFFTEDNEGLPLVHALAREPVAADPLAGLKSLFPSTGQIKD